MTKDSLGKLLSGIILTIIICVIVYITCEKYFLSEYSKYTIGITTYKSKGSKNVDFHVYFYFIINGVKINDVGGMYPNMKIPNGRYYVKFYPKYLRFNEILNIEVPDSIKEAPEDGWNEIPK